MTAATSRISFSFSADGVHAACLSRNDKSPLALEWWSVRGAAAERLLLSTRRGETTFTQACCLRDGRILLTRPGPGVHRLALLTPGRGALAEQALTVVACPGLRLVDSPRQDAPAVAIGNLGDGRSVIWRIRPGQPCLEPAAEVPGALGRGCWLDADGGQLGVNQHTGGTTRPVVVNLDDGTTQPLPGTSPGQHLLLASPRSGLLLLAGPAGDGLRLGHAIADGHAPVRFPGHLDAVAGSVAPMAIDPSGEHVALQVDRGARSHLMIYTPADERVREAEIPAGVIHGGGRWSAHGLRFAFSSPARPAGIATVTVDDRDSGPRWSFAAGDAPGQRPWADARACQFNGPAGPLEAVVYGPDDLADARDVLVALHGGPEDAARLTFDPLWQALAAAGIAIVAPNYRGSTGYGRPHQLATRHAWGGPDLADIRHLARQLAGRRPPGSLMVLGVSYGAFLAMLAASADPQLWSHCVAVAPFISGPRLHEAGSPGVRALLDRLGGQTLVHDELGPRDLARLCGRITARLMLVHAAGDEVVPVGQSRELRRLLIQAGRREGRDFTYTEPAAGGHDFAVSASDVLGFLHTASREGR
jgi:pimeloyl-ACP methyl ester carboxylesterase